MFCPNFFMSKVDIPKWENWPIRSPNGKIGLSEVQMGKLAYPKYKWENWPIQSTNGKIGLIQSTNGKIGLSKVQMGK